MIALWLLSVYGMTLILTRGAIFAPLRALFPKPVGQIPFFGTLLRCALCLGWWAGIFHYAMGFRAIALGDAWWEHTLSAFFSGCAASGGVWLLFLVSEKLDQSNFLDRD